MRNRWEADFKAMNKAAGNGLRLTREDSRMYRQDLASLLKVMVEIIRKYEAGTTSIPTSHLYYADKIFKGGYDYYFYPYCRPELFSNPMANVIRFPRIKK